MDNRAQTQSDPLNKSTWKLLMDRKEVRDFVTRPELFSLLMWLPSLVSPFSRSSVGQRTFSSAAFQRAPRVCFEFLRRSHPREDLLIPTDEGTAEMQGLLLRVRGERPHVPVSAIRSKNSRGRREPSASWRKGGFLDFSYKS